MNIFYLHADAKTCAQQHVDKHCVKMIVEYAQILSTAHRVIDGHESVINYILKDKQRKKKVWTHPNAELNTYIYKASHINHPSNKWVRNSYENYSWLYSLWIELLKEYSYRYSKQHSCERLIPYLEAPPKNIPNGSFSPPWRAMPDDYKVDKSNPNYCIESYRAYYKGAKAHIHKWKNRPTPDWI